MFQLAEHLPAHLSPLQSPARFRKDAALDRIVARYHEDRAALQEDTASVERLCAILRAGGALVTDVPSARVLKALADAGVFHLGGMLVGTHAFVVLGNILGVRWTGGALRTMDIDVAAEPSLNIAVPALHGDLPDVLAQLEMGFLPVPPLDPRKPSTSFKVRGQGLRVVRRVTAGLQALDAIDPDAGAAARRRLKARRGVSRAPPSTNRFSM